MGTLRVRGVDLRVNRYRSGPDGPRPVIVFVHGLCVVDQSSLSFTLGLPLATHADVILYDLRGHGRSEVVPSGYRVVDHVADLVALLDTLAVHEPVHLVAHSYGGAVAVVAALRHGERVASLTLVDGFLPFRGWGRLIDRTLQSAGRALRHEYSPEDAMRVLGMTSPRKAMAVAARARRLILETTLSRDVRREPPLRRQDYARIRCPVLGIYGDRSPLHPLAGKLRRRLPAAELHILAGADHLLNLERPREVRTLVSRFVGLPVGVPL
ncbi:MAG: alpha/beta fold hydrolase [Acidimicrobiales bacterium]